MYGDVALVRNVGRGLATNIEITPHLDPDSLDLLGSRQNKAESIVEKIELDWGTATKSLQPGESAVLSVRKNILFCSAIEARYEDVDGNSYSEQNINQAV